MSNYLTLQSSDGVSFHIDERVAEVSALLNKFKNEKKFNIELKEIRSEILEVVLDYMHHKYYYDNLVDIEKATDFKITERLALEVLNASIFLGC